MSEQTPFTLKHRGAVINADAVMSVFDPLDPINIVTFIGVYLAQTLFIMDRGADGKYQWKKGLVSALIPYLATAFALQFIKSNSVH